MNRDRCSINSILPKIGVRDHHHRTVAALVPSRQCLPVRRHRIPLTFDACNPTTGGANGSATAPAVSAPAATRTKAVNCSNDDEIYAFHTGGANLARCDGSVSFFSESVSFEVVGALITRNNGEVIPGDL